MSNVITLNRRSFLVPTIPDKFQDLDDAQITILQLQRCLGNIVRSLQNSTLSELTTPLAVADGGTGATTAPEARTNLEAAKSGANTDITSLSGLTTPLADTTKLIVSNWTLRTSAADNNWFSVCWSPELGLFVAVADTGTGNRVMTSPDGINWTIRTSAADNEWHSVCWSPELGLFVVVAYTGTGNRVMTSPDGINWTLRTSAADNGWYSVCWSPELGLFATVAASGSGNRVMTSLFYK